MVEGDHSTGVGWHLHRDHSARAKVALFVVGFLLGSACEHSLASLNDTVVELGLSARVGEVGRAFDSLSDQGFDCSFEVDAHGVPLSDSYIE